MNVWEQIDVKKQRYDEERARALTACKAALEWHHREERWDDVAVWADEFGRWFLRARSTPLPLGTAAASQLQWCAKSPRGLVDSIRSGGAEEVEASA